MPPFDPELALLLSDALKRAASTSRRIRASRRSKSRGDALTVTFTDGSKAQTGAVVLALGGRARNGARQSCGPQKSQKTAALPSMSGCAPQTPIIFAAGDAVRRPRRETEGDAGAACRPCQSPREERRSKPFGRQRDERKEGARRERRARLRDDRRVRRAKRKTAQTRRHRIPQDLYLPASRTRAITRAAHRSP